VLQEQEIKGFTIFELLVVITIVGIISAVGYPNFSKWKKDRNVRLGAERIFSLYANLISQTQRGQYSYVRIKTKINKKDNSVELITQGMRKDTFSKELNAGTALSCSDKDNWDNEKINSYKTSDLATHLDEDGSVCFSIDGSYYQLEGKLDKNDNIFIENRNIAKKDYMIICYKSVSKKSKKITKCPKLSLLGKDDPAYLIEWSRFGTINKFKWDGNGWRRL
tara:strand:- start:7843 stop:8508 length:666 start_codon:yes stop_codon:yes gene_type:complete